MRIEVLGEEALPGGPARLSGRLLALVGALCPCQAAGPEHVSPSEREPPSRVQVSGSSSLVGHPILFSLAQKILINVYLVWY